MAGPQSFTPGPNAGSGGSVKPSRPKRRFTLAQANSTLPLVRRIVNDIVQAHGAALQAQAELEQKPTADAARKEAQRHLEQAMMRIEDCVDELTEVGCDLKDYRIGLIDFIGRHKGHDICLCWKLGEEQVGYWHELNTGFAGRQPVSTLKESE